MSVQSFIKSGAVAMALAVAFMATPKAADFGNSGEPMYTPGRVAQSWGGLYGGAHLGMTRGNFKTALATPFSKFDMATTSLSGGLFGGYNMHLNSNWVVGVEGDFTLQDVKKDTIISSTTYNGDTNWMMSARGRLGYAMDALMLYGTAGLAFTTLDFTGGAFKDDKATIGWALGTGAEVKLTDKLFGRGEYIYTGFNKEAFALGANRATTELSTHTIRAGLGYRF